MNLEKLKAGLTRFLPSGKWGRVMAAVVAVYLVIVMALGFYWSAEPDAFSVQDNLNARLGPNTQPVIGAMTTATLIEVAETLLRKPGGYLSNDVMPPGIYLDNIPNWEFGALVQVRDLSRAFRENFSRSQSQSSEDRDLAVVEPQFSTTNDRWMFPSTEGEYRDALRALESYLQRISNPADRDAQFYARADNLARWLVNVESRLGSLSQRLSASVGQTRSAGQDLAGDRAAQQSNPDGGQRTVRTPALQVDDVFYEARGATWALMHFLQAIEIDFEAVLRDKNALVSVRQIIRELELSQRTVYSPIILNGGGYGLFANHSLVMANYISRANAAIIDLRELLNQG